MDEAARIRRAAQERKAEIALFRRVLNSEDGKLFLDALRKQFRTSLPSFLPMPEKAQTGAIYDPIHAALREGQRSVIIYMDTMRESPFMDIPTDKPEVIK